MYTIQAGFIRAALVFCGGLCLSAPASVVQAQQADAQAEASTGELGKIVVTGSRIQRRDYEANSPIVTVDDSSAEELEHRGDRDQPHQAAAVPSGADAHDGW